MTTEEKQLLLADLCARLPYGVAVHVEGMSDFDGEIEPYDTPLSLGLLQNFIGHSFTLKPYLRPLSSMTEEELNELEDISCLTLYPNGIQIPNGKDYDWLNAHHFDYRGLIPMGLALEAPEDIYKN